MTVSPAVARTRWALLAGNFVIGFGIMVVAGTLNDLVARLEVPVATGGQLISIAATTLALSAPLLAGVVAGWDRRRLLALSLVWYGLGHLLCAMQTSFVPLAAVRAATVLAAAIFTPQAAAAIGHMASAVERGRAITFIFVGWSVASVLGMPLGAWIGEHQGWAAAFGCVGGVSLAVAVWVWRAMPDGVRPPALSASAWRSVLGSPVLMGTVAVTALQGAGQFAMLSYIAPYLRQSLGAAPEALALLFAWFGAAGLLGNVMLSRWIDRLGPDRAVMGLLWLVVLGMLLWPLAGSAMALALAMTSWGLGCFAVNSAQQARLGIAAPALAPALMALNSSAIYLGQALGAASGGALIAAEGYARLWQLGLAWVALSIVLSAWAARAARARVAAAAS